VRPDSRPDSAELIESWIAPAFKLGAGFLTPGEGRRARLGFSASAALVLVSPEAVGAVNFEVGFVF
jgi:hypothetical protein